MKNNEISLCMIAKNEEKHLEQCLDSVKDFVDEIIIVDTGSTDRTKEMAKKYNAKIFDFKWCDDFSAARNESIRHATKGWVLVLDADEVFAARDAPKLRQLVLDDGCIGYYFTRRNYTNDSSASGWVSSENDSYEESSQTSGWFCSRQIRLFRNKKGIKYQGIVHEEIQSMIHSLGNVKESQFPIHHFGVMGEEKKGFKNQLYTRLGESKIAGKSGFEEYCELGVQAQQMKDYGKAVELFKKSLELNKGYYKSWLNIGGCYIILNELGMAEQALSMAISLNPHDYSAHNNLAVVYAKSNNPEKAIAELLESIRLNPDNASTYFNLGLAYDGINAKDKAYKSFKRAVELNPKYREKVKISL